MTSLLPAVLIEAFAAEPLQGNGAAVVLLEQPASAGWMQALAGSLRQSETAFLHHRSDGQWQLRWFTPTCEVPLCGHATLAATLALAHWGRLQTGEALQLASRSGSLSVQLDPGQPGTAALVLPGGGMSPLPVPEALAEQLNLTLLGYWGSPLGYRVALVSDAADLEGLANPASRLSGQDRQGLVVMQPLKGTAPVLLGQPCDYQLRFFAPGLGIDEDPVTGSAHALVAPWWMERLGRSQVRGWQASPRRGGMLCENAGPDLVRLTGSGQLLWDGRINAAGSGCDPSGWDSAVRL
jgi:predicted PhzF superfamily epimerase YddE/YHI9